MDRDGNSEASQSVQSRNWLPALVDAHETFLFIAGSYNRAEFDSSRNRTIWSSRLTGPDICCEWNRAENDTNEEEKAADSWESEWAWMEHWRKTLVRITNSAQLKLQLDSYVYWPRRRRWDHGNAKKKAVGEREDVRKKKVSQAKINEQFFIIILLVLHNSRVWFWMWEKKSLPSEKLEINIKHFSHLIALRLTVYLLISRICCFIGEVSQSLLDARNVTFPVPMTLSRRLYTLALDGEVFMCRESSSSAKHQQQHNIQLFVRN